MGSTMGSAEDFRRMLRAVTVNKLKPVVDRGLWLGRVRAAMERMEATGNSGRSRSKSGSGTASDKSRDGDGNSAGACFCSAHALPQETCRTVSPLWSSIPEVCRRTFLERVDYGNDRFNDAAVGTEAPGFALPDTEGNLVSFSNFDEARALVVVFMCNHCPFVKHVINGLVKLVRNTSHAASRSWASTPMTWASFPKIGRREWSSSPERRGHVPLPLR